jgi:type IV fimbrial biogenesis protein FimT
MLTSPKKPPFNQGFTLIELLVTITIAGILLSIAIPSFTSVIRKNRLTTINNEFVTSLNFARSEAVKRGVSVWVRKSGSNWEDGWNVFIDADDDNVFDSGETLLRTHGALATGYTLRGNNNFTNFIRFTSRGQSNQNGTFYLCDRGGDTTPAPYTSKLIIVNPVGRVRVGEDTNNDGIPNDSSGSNMSTCTP